MVKSCKQIKQSNHAQQNGDNKINAQGKQKGTRLITCLDYTLNHNQKKKN